MTPRWIDVQYGQGYRELRGPKSSSTDVVEPPLSRTTRDSSDDDDGVAPRDSSAVSKDEYPRSLATLPDLL